MKRIIVPLSVRLRAIEELKQAHPEGKGLGLCWIDSHQVFLAVMPCEEGSWDRHVSCVLMPHEAASHSTFIDEKLEPTLRALQATAEKPARFTLLQQKRRRALCE